MPEWPNVAIRKDTMASDESGWILVAPGHEAYPTGETNEPHHRVETYIPVSTLLSDEIVEAITDSPLGPSKARVREILRMAIEQVGGGQG